MHIAEGGGPPQHVRPWLAALAERGSLEVVAPGRGSVLDLYAPLARTTVLSYAPLTLPTGPLALLGEAWRHLAEVARFYRHLGAQKPDLVVIVTSVIPSALVACRLTRTPAIVYAAEILERGSIRSWLGKWIVRLNVRLASAVVCASQTVAAQFSRNGRATVTTIYPGIDASRLSGERDRFRETHGISGADPCLAVLGNITAGRGQDLVIRALPLLRATFPHVHCLIAGRPLERPGDRAYLDHLERLVTELGVGDAVTFAGFVEPVADVYAAADIVVNPARVKEGLGRVAIEALAAGRPVVAARVGAIPEVLRADRDALLVEPDDSEELAAAVVRLWTDRELRLRLVASGRTRAVSTFREDVGVAAFCRVVDQVVSA
jgi:glycosyltransferase involved in cell wall biosynthesis